MYLAVNTFTKFFWSRYYESNVDLKFRKLLFYPLNYSEKMITLLKHTAVATDYRYQLVSLVRPFPGY